MKTLIFAAISLIVNLTLSSPSTIFALMIFGAPTKLQAIDPKQSIPQLTVKELSKDQ